jgi:hypothetical protein
LRSDPGALENNSAVPERTMLGLDWTLYCAAKPGWASRHLAGKRLKI